MRAIWSGVLGFGLVNIPVHLYSPATEEMLDLDYLHKKDKSPIRYARICKEEEKEIPYEDIVRGYDHDGTYVVLQDADFKHANAKKTSAIEITEFVGEDEIDLMYAEKPYYLEPDEKSGKSYALFREALNRTHKVGIAKFVLRNREHVVVVRPFKEVIMVNQLRFAREIKPYSSLKLPSSEGATAKELAMATQLIASMTGKFKPEKYHDTYTEELMEVIKRKAKGLPVAKKAKAPQPTKVRDLMSQLRASLKAQERAEVRV